MLRINYGRYSHQYVVIYIVYMMIGSLFHKCICRNPETEKYLYLHFVEMPEKKEMEIEENILKVMDSLDENFKDALSDLNCEVNIRKDKDEYHILFQTGGFEEVDVSVKENGKFHITPVATQSAA